ncbi:MAG: alkaline phosphatase D family protein, partial [Nannocystaceae bacterium]
AGAGGGPGPRGRGTAPLDSTGRPGDSSTGADDDSSGDTGEPTECVDEAFVETFDAEAIPQDDAVFPYAIMAGEMRTTSALLAVQVPAMPPAEAIWLRVWRPGADEGTVSVVVEAEVELDADGYAKIPVEGLCPGTWYRYAYFVGSPARATARSPIAELRTAPEDDVLEPLSVAITACNGSSLDWPALLRTADEYYDVFIHLGDMVYADGSFSRQEYRQVWRQYLAAPGYRTALSRSGMYATWDDHEIDDNSNFDRETMSADQLLKRQNAMDAFFETLPIEAEGPDYQLWRTFRWGLTAEIIVLDCRYERRPSIDQYISPAQMDFLKQRLLDSPCHFKIVVNSVPITNMPTLWDIAAGDRWEGYPGQRNELLSFIDDNLITNVWFLSGDFHTCFVSRIEPAGGLTSNTYEIAVTGGNSNPLPDFATGFDLPQFDYGTTDPRGCLLLFDPESNAVNIRFLDPETGEALFDETISQAGG